jgi:hypothetical protein
VHSDQLFTNLIGCGDKYSRIEHKWSGSCCLVLQISDSQGKKATQASQKQDVLITKMTKYSFW